MSKKYLKLKYGECKDDDVLPLWRKLCFAVGGAPYQITTNVIGFFFSIFLLEVAEIDPIYISVISFAGKAWDAMTDPACGYLVNRTKKRFGQMKPWIILSAPLACTAYFFLFYVPDLSMEGKFGYYFAMYCAFQGLLSGLHVPYSSLTMYISNKQTERDSATAYRMVFEAIGVLTGVIVQGKIIEKYRVAGECTDDMATISSDSLHLQELSYRNGSFIVIGIYMLCSITVFLGVKEIQGVVDETGNNDSYFSSIKMVFTYKPYMKASGVFLFMSLAVFIVQGNIALFCTHSLKMGDQFSNFVIVLLVVSIAAMPLWQLLLLKFGKKKIYAAGIMLLIPVLMTQLYLPKDNAFAYYLMMGFAGLSISVSLLLPWSVLPDVLDLFMLEKHTRNDAMFYSFYVFFNKLAAGIGIALSQLALSLGGYVTGACNQPESVDLTLRLLVVPGPVICLLLALLCLWSYPIDEEKRQAIKQEVLETILKKAKEPVASYEPSMSYESIRVASDSTEV